MLFYLESCQEVAYLFLELRIFSEIFLSLLTWMVEKNALRLHMSSRSYVYASIFLAGLREYPPRGDGG
jgi:hypothetical protein